MDVNGFVLELTRSLPALGPVELIALNAEGPIVQGYIYVRQAVFVRFYFNQVTRVSEISTAREALPGGVWADGAGDEYVWGWAGCEADCSDVTRLM